MVEQARGWHQHFLGFRARINCENIPVIPAWLVRHCLDDPRKIPYLFVWKSERDGEAKEGVRLSRYSEAGPWDWTGWVELKRTDGTHTLVRTIERTLPRNGGKALLLICPGCRKPCRALYGWEWDNFSRRSDRCRRSNWECRCCAGLRYSSEGGALLIRGGPVSRVLGRPVPDSPSPRPELWLPYVFASPMDAVAAGFAKEKEG
jgi:hypothetical protein